MATDLQDMERLAARMFFNVSVQTALALEDPNQRFGLEFQFEDALKTKQVTSFDDVVSKSYVTELEEGKLTFITNPEGLPALSRVVMQGGDALAVIKALDEALAQGEKYTAREETPFPQSDGKPLPEGAGSRHITLLLDEELKPKHDVTLLFAWGGASDKNITLDLMAWPVDKIADAKQ